nr:MAG TPA: hypothetical protein [Caudoviricetes sp.]
MTQKYIVCDIVEYDNKVMVIKEPRDGSHFDLFCPKEGLVYCFVGVDKIKPVDITPAILERNGWDKEGKDGSVFSLSEAFMGGDKDDEDNYTCFQLYYQNKEDGWVIDMRGEPLKFEVHYVYELQHFLFGLGLDSSMIV